MSLFRGPMGLFWWLALLARVKPPLFMLVYKKWIVKSAILWRSRIPLNTICQVSAKHRLICALVWPLPGACVLFCAKTQMLFWLVRFAMARQQKLLLRPVLRVTWYCPHCILIQRLAPSRAYRTWVLIVFFWPQQFAVLSLSGYCESCAQTVVKR